MGWDQPIQLIGPVLHEDEVSRWHGSDVWNVYGDEALAVRHDPNNVRLTFEQSFWRSVRDFLTRIHVDDHRPGALSVKKLPAPGIPPRLDSTFRRDTPLATRPWVGLDVDLRLAGLVRLVRDKASVRRERRPVLVEPRLQRTARVSDRLRARG